MKNVFIVLIGTFFSLPTVSQNLVVNPSLDGFITCPGFGQFSSTYIISWDKPSIGSSDYYHFNCAGIQPAVQAPHSGEGYAGIICYNFGTEYREYITGTFSTPLTAGVLYDVEFWVSLHDGYIQAIEEVDAYISNTSPGPFANALHINVVPQIQNVSGALNDTANWKRVNGQYLATGGEQFITIGNFNDDAGTTITQPGSTGSFGAYYFIDDVSVKADSTTSIPYYVETLQPVITIVGGNQIAIKLPGNETWRNSCKMLCYDITGRVRIDKIIHSGNVTINDFSEGIYIVVLESESGVKFRKKLFIR